MGRASKDRATNRTKSAGRMETLRERGGNWDPENPEEDPSRDLRDIYEEENGPVDDDYIWPENEEIEDD